MESKTNLIFSKAMQEITVEEYDASIKMLKGKVDEINDRLDKLGNVNLEIGQGEVQKNIATMVLDVVMLKIYITN